MVGEFNNDQPPLLSITVLNYNYGDFLPRCLDSILGQSFKNFELILINDKSTDNSLEIIQPYLKDSRIRLVDHEINRGFVYSLLEGVELSLGKYITVISADDWALSMLALSKQITVLEQDPEVAFVFSAYRQFDEEEKYNYIWRADDNNYVRPGKEAFNELVLNPFLLHSGTVIRRAAYDQVGGYDSSFGYSVDTKMWLSLCHAGKVGYINEVFYAYRRHMTSLSKSSASIRKAIEEVMAAIDHAFGQFPPDERPKLDKLQDQAERRALVAFVVDDIFRNYYRVGWQRYWVALHIRFSQTFFQKTTGLLILRTLLGERGYSWLEKLKASYSPKTRHRLTVSSIEYPDLDQPAKIRMPLGKKSEV